MSVDNSRFDHLYVCKKCRDRNYLIQCACGTCDEVIFKRSKYGVLKTYVKGHNERKNNNTQYHCERCRDKNFLIECKCNCGRVLPKRDKQGVVREFLLNHHFNLPENLKDQWGFNNAMWKTGRTKKGDYWYVRVDGKYELEHVYFYEQFHKVCVLPWSVVHHIDENKENNMPWNTETMFWGEHTTYHSVIDTSGRWCVRCGADHTYDNWFYDENRNFICRRCYNNLCYDKNKKKRK
jgi:hypothetical protein